MSWCLFMGRSNQASVFIGIVEVWIVGYNSSSGKPFYNLDWVIPGLSSLSYNLQISYIIVSVAIRMELFIQQKDQNITRKCEHDWSKWYFGHLYLTGVGSQLWWYGQTWVWLVHAVKILGVYKLSPINQSYQNLEAFVVAVDILFQHSPWVGHNRRIFHWHIYFSVESVILGFEVVNRCLLYHIKVYALTNPTKTSIH